MKIEFTYQEVESIILEHARRVCPGHKFNKVSMPRSYAAEITVEFEEEEVLEVGGAQ